jgi:AraC family transcriptional regulator
VSIKNISQAVGVHPIHLTRSFQSFYRCTPGEFLRNLRLRRSAELLVSTKLSVAEIALESGFFDQSHLTRHFRRTFGIPPGEFRSISN